MAGRDVLEAAPRFVLGTVQLGLDYGIANQEGKPDFGKAVAIVEAAWRLGIRHFDTAQAYGDSEAVLGRALKELGVADEARVGSKLAAKMDPGDLGRIRGSIDLSLDRLGVQRLWYVLLHDPAWLARWDEGLGELLREYRDKGSAERLGASLIRPSNAKACLRHPDVEVIQAPSNAWDHRLRHMGLFTEARDLGKLCCVRSIYLQGLLTMTPEAVAERLPVAAEASRRWNGLAAQLGMGTKELAVRYALTLEAPLVVGAESPEQLEETVELAERGPLRAGEVEALGAALDGAVGEEVVEPFRWERK